MTQTILIVDDEATQRNILQHVVSEKLGYRGVMLSSGEEALNWIQKSRQPVPDLVLLDYELGVNNAIDVMHMLTQHGIDIPVIVVTAYGDMEKARASIQAGAFDFLSKPVNIERLDVSLRNALHAKNLQSQVCRLEKKYMGSVSFSDMIGMNKQFSACIAQAHKAANNSFPILLEGENGTGKESLALAIHGAGYRKKNPFMELDCASLGDSQTKLYEKFYDANGGTIYLVGICNLRLECQAKLLRAIQESEVTLGEDMSPKKIDVRVISSTERCLDGMTERGEFRSDLKYRLSNTHIKIPGLRDRRDDIHLLVNHFIQKYAAREYKTIRGISSSAMGMLVSHTWLGNVRQLENIVFRAVVMTENMQLDIDDFELLFKPQFRTQPEVVSGVNLMALSGLAAGSPSSLMSLVGSSGHMKRIDQLEVEAIRYALQYYKGHMSEVARRLGIGRSTLYRKMHDFNITLPESA